MKSIRELLIRNTIIVSISSVRTKLSFGFLKASLVSSGRPLNSAGLISQYLS